MTDITPIQGELQAQIMAAIWRIETGTVEQVRGALPPRYCGAYTTVQTVLNRLAERGFLARKRSGQAIVYRPKLTEAQYLSRTIESTLASASAHARHAALAQLIGGLEDGELADLQRLAGEVDGAREEARVSVALAFLVCSAIAGPHLLRLEAAHPATASGVPAEDEGPPKGDGAWHSGQDSGGHAG